MSDDDREDDDLARVLRSEPEELLDWLWSRSRRHPYEDLFDEAPDPTAEEP